MSRIGKSPIPIPAGVEVKIGNGRISAKGPKGELGFDLPAGIGLFEQDGILNVRVLESEKSRRHDKHTRAMSGTTRAMVSNLVTGVGSGFEKKLNITGVGYRAQAQGRNLNLSLGYSHPVVYALPEGVSVETPTQTEIIIRGADKQVVGQTAAEIRAYRPPEPYKGKGVRYSDERVVRKQAKKK